MPFLNSRVLSFVANTCLFCLSRMKRPGVLSSAEPFFYLFVAFATWIFNERTTLSTNWRFGGHSLCFKGHCLIKSYIHHWFTSNFAHRSVITKWSFWHILNWKMSRGSVNNKGCLIINFESKADLFITSVINNYILSFSSFLNKVKVKINGF